MGGGTVVVEAMTAGRPSYGSDLNPVGLEVTWARTRAWSKQNAETFLEEARRCVKGSREYRTDHERVPEFFFRTEGEWYDPPAIMEVWGLREKILEQRDPAIRRMLHICLSSILVKVSRQASDSVTRVDREHQWVPKGRVESLFTRRTEEHAKNLVQATKALPDIASEPILRLADATEPLELPVSSVDAIISSPPYPGTYDYVEHHRRRYIALGLDPKQAEKGEIGSRRRQKKVGSQAITEFRDSLTRAINAWNKSLAQEGSIYLVLGDGQSKEGVVATKPILSDALRKTDFEIAAWASQPRFVRGAVGRGLKAGKYEHIFALCRKGEKVRHVG